MKKKICIVLCLGCIGTVSVVGCSNKNFDSKVTGDNQTTTENVSDILNDQEKKEAVISIKDEGIGIDKKYLIREISDTLSSTLCLNCKLGIKK